jgi:nitroreductase
MLRGHEPLNPFAKPTMNVFEALAARRSIKRFTDRPLQRAEIEQLLEAAVLAPNHRMTQPWRFHVLGPEARRAYGEALGARKARKARKVRKVEDPEAGELVRRKVADEHAALPSMIAVSMRLDENPETREEDYAATFMAIENLSLAAVAVGLGAHIKTGAVMDDPSARAAAGIPEGERLVAIVNVGEPAEVAAPKPRTAAAELTRWLP